MLRYALICFLAAGATTMSLRLSESVTHAASVQGASAPVFPKDGVEVRVEVVKVAHPLIDSPSLAGDRSKATLRVLSGQVPSQPSVSEISLAFDHHGPDGPRFEKGKTLVLRFTGNGRLFDVVEQ